MAARGAAGPKGSTSPSSIVGPGTSSNRRLELELRLPEEPVVHRDDVVKQGLDFNAVLNALGGSLVDRNNRAELHVLGASRHQAVVAARQAPIRCQWTVRRSSVR